MATHQAESQRRALVFAYGSNMDPAQTASRTPSALLVGSGCLKGWGLAFAGFSTRWGGAVATIRPAPALRTHGVIWAITTADLERLDRFEGCPNVYRRIEVTAWIDDLALKVWAYQHNDQHAFAAPSAEYLSRLINGYESAGISNYHQQLQRALKRSIIEQ